MISPEDSVNAVNKNSRVVVLKYMFTLKELEQDTALLLDLKEDVREECATLGEVTNVVLYDVGHHESSALSRCLTLSFLYLERTRRRHDSQISRSSQRPSLCSRESISILLPSSS